MARGVYCPPILHSGLTVSTMTVGASVPFHSYNVGKVLAKGMRTLLFSWKWASSQALKSAANLPWWHELG